jgi:UDP-GlcNAc:undecaprenyl-phosphate GlcNAc-1-phosphate transferase
MIFILCLFAFLFSWILMNLLLSPAQKFDLLDKPNSRKKHEGNIPLIGGICIFASFIVMMFVMQIWTKTDCSAFLLCIFIIIVLGILDDFKNISLGFRVVLQCFVAVIMFSTADNGIIQLGNLLNTGLISTRDWALPLTILAVVSGINALNMMDGIDGLAGLLSLISLLCLAFFEFGSNNSIIILVLCAAILPVLGANLGLLGANKKIFLGDAGSIGLGFVIVWFLVLFGANANSQEFKPIIAVWLFAIPLMDMTALAIRRLGKGKSPFSADRDHLHHFFQRCGFSDKKALLIIASLHASLALIGVIANYLNIPEYIMLYGFLFLFGLYFYTMWHAWIIAKKIRRKNIKTLQ